MTDRRFCLLSAAGDIFVYSSFSYFTRSTEVTLLSDCSRNEYGVSAGNV